VERLGRTAGLVLLVAVGISFALVPNVASADATYPAPSAFVVDTADVVPAPVEQQIDGQLTSFEDRTGHQMAVVVVPTLDGQSVDEYARGLFDRWGIGHAGVDDGAVLLVATRDRKVRVQVGSGLSNTLSDDAAVDVVNDITPILHRDDFAGGVLAGEREMRRVIGDQQLDAYVSPRAPHFGGGQAVAATSGKHGHTSPWVVGVTLGIGGLVALGSIVFFGTRLGRGGGIGGAGGGGFTGGYVGGMGGGGGGGAVGGGGGASGGF
jgi:uncharacterized protein